jgi:hypothetical protein
MDGFPLKLLEGILLLLAVLAFGWWQLRDVRRAQAETARRRAAEGADTGTPSPAPAGTARERETRRSPP